LIINKQLAACTALLLDVPWVTWQHYSNRRTSWRTLTWNKRKETSVTGLLWPHTVYIYWSHSTLHHAPWTQLLQFTNVTRKHTNVHQNIAHKTVTNVVW